MLITGYNKKRDQIIKSVEKYLDKLEAKGVISRYGLEESHGMGSYETFYISFELPGNETDSWEIRFSGHDGSYSNPNYSLWNNDFKTVTELKKAILECVEEQRREEGLC